MRLFSGKPLVAAEGRAYYDLQEQWLPLIEQKRPRYVAEAVLFSPLLDGREPDACGIV